MIAIVPYKSSWSSEFNLIGTEIKAVLGGLIGSIHHIGSTSVPGLSAKDIIDIQITVQCFDAEIEKRLTKIGFEKRDGIISDHRPLGHDELPDAELQKEFYQKHSPKANLHVRISGTFNQRYPLLCREYLRADPHTTKLYEQIKINLAKYLPNDSEAYYDIKDPVFDIIMINAEAWAINNGWSTPRSDIL